MSKLEAGNEQEAATCAEWPLLVPAVTPPCSAGPHVNIPWTKDGGGGWRALALSGDRSPSLESGDVGAGLGGHV